MFKMRFLTCLLLLSHLHFAVNTLEEDRWPGYPHKSMFHSHVDARPLRECSPDSPCRISEGQSYFFMVDMGAEYPVSNIQIDVRLLSKCQLAGEGHKFFLNNHLVKDEAKTKESDCEANLLENGESEKNMRNVHLNLLCGDRTVAWGRYFSTFLNLKGCKGYDVPGLHRINFTVIDCAKETAYCQLPSKEIIRLTGTKFPDNQPHIVYGVLFRSKDEAGQFTKIFIVDHRAGFKDELEYPFCEKVDELYFSCGQGLVGHELKFPKIGNHQACECSLAAADIYSKKVYYEKEANPRIPIGFKVLRAGNNDVRIKYTGINGDRSLMYYKLLRVGVKITCNGSIVGGGFIPVVTSSRKGMVVGDSGNLLAIAGVDTKCKLKIDAVEIEYWDVDEKYLGGMSPKDINEELSDEVAGKMSPEAVTRWQKIHGIIINVTLGFTSFIILALIIAIVAGLFVLACGNRKDGEPFWVDQVDSDQTRRIHANKAMKALYDPKVSEDESEYDRAAGQIPRKVTEYKILRSAP